MEDKIKNDRKKYTILLIICTALGTIMILVGLYFTFIKKDDKPVDNGENNQQEIEKDDEQEETDDNLYKPIPYEEYKENLKDYSPTFEILENKPQEMEINAYGDTYKLVLTNDGKVTVSKNGGKTITISNIDGAVNMYYINDISYRLFVLLSNGDVYWFYVDEIIEKNNATKINKVSGGTKFVITSYDPCNGKGCGGGLSIGVLTKDNQYIDLDSYQA